MVTKKYGSYEGGYYSAKFRVFKLNVVGKNCMTFSEDRHEVTSFGDIEVGEGMIFFGDIEVGEDMGVFDLEDGILTTHYPGVSKSFYSFHVCVTYTPSKLFEVEFF